MTTALSNWHRVALARLVSSVKRIGHFFNQHVQIECRCQIRAFYSLKGLFFLISGCQVIDFREIQSEDVSIPVTDKLQYQKPTGSSWYPAEWYHMFESFSPYPAGMAAGPWIEAALCWQEHHVTVIEVRG